MKTRYGWKFGNRIQVIRIQADWWWRIRVWEWPHANSNARLKMGRVFRSLLIGPIEIRLWDRPMPPDIEKGIS